MLAILPAGDPPEHNLDAEPLQRRPLANRPFQNQCLIPDSQPHLDAAPPVSKHNPQQLQRHVIADQNPLTHFPFEH